MSMEDMDQKEVLEARVREDRIDLVHPEDLDAISRLESLEKTTRSVQEVPQVLRIVKVKVVDKEPETQRLASVTDQKCVWKSWIRFPRTIVFIVWRETQVP